MAVALGDGTQAGDLSYVYDLSPNDEARYDANFYFDPNGASTNGQPVDIFTGLDQQGQPIFGILYQAAGATSYQLRAWSLIHGARSFTPWYTVVPESEPEDDPLSSVHKLDVAWQSAARGGGISLYIDDLHFATLSGDTLAYKLNEVLLGAVEGLTSGASGTVYFDEFTSSQVSGMQYAMFLPMIGH